MATKCKVCCSIKVSNENLDLDLMDFQPTEKKKRFTDPVSEEQISSYAKDVITHKSTKWAVNAFTAWVCERNKTATYSEQCPKDLLSNKPTTEELNLWLCRFMLEARKGDGTQYPAKSLYQILCGLYRHAKSQ